MTNHYYFVLNTSLFAFLIINLSIKTAVYLKFQKATDTVRFFYSLQIANAMAIQPVTVWRKRQNLLTTIALINSIMLLTFSIAGIIAGN